MDKERPNLADYVTIREAAQMIHRSEKQTRRYTLSDPPLLPGSIKIPNAKNGIIFIPRASIEAFLQGQHVHLEDTIDRRLAILTAHFQEEIDTLARQVYELSRQLAEMQDEIHRLKSRPAPPVWTPRPAESLSYNESRPVTQPKEVTQGEIAISVHELPEDAIELADFAPQVGLTRRSLLEYVMKHRLSHYAVPIPARPKEKKRYVTQEQQQKILEARQS